MLTWRVDTFGYAESWDEAAARYRGLRGGQQIGVAPDDAGLLVRPDVAGIQLDAEVAIPSPPAPPLPSPAGGDRGPWLPPAAPAPPPRRFHGSMRLDSARVGRDAGRIADEVIAHLSGQVGAEVIVTLEIDARLPSGAGDRLVRTVTEYSRTLKFDSHGCETE